jgi:hypothetical protein
MFKRNEGLLDRVVRVVVGLALLPAGLFLLGGLQGSALGLVAAGLGVLGLITGLTGVCPLYIPFGISTLKKEKELISVCSSMGGSCSPGNKGARQTCCSDPQSMEGTHTQQG